MKTETSPAPEDAFRIRGDALHPTGSGGRDAKLTPPGDSLEKIRDRQ